MIRVGIIGAAGYTAGELIRILINHPEAEIVFAQSSSNAGNLLTDVHEGLLGDTDLRFCPEADLKTADVVFLCSGHGKSAAFWKEHSCPEGLRIIDLAQDFRDESEGYVYGLPEWKRDAITGATKIANPGCFATAIQLSLLPLACAGLVGNEIQVTAITGSTGAGVTPGETTHFSWRANNISTYKEFSHQHLAEMRRNLGIISGTPVGINFVPVRGDFTRGIFGSVYTDCSLGGEEAAALYRSFYKDAAFTVVSDRALDLKQVVNTNKAALHLEKIGGKLVVTCVIDNLLKGASGQAVQNMNLMFGIDEKAGLKLKASAF